MTSGRARSRWRSGFPGRRTAGTAPPIAYTAGQAASVSSTARARSRWSCHRARTRENAGFLPLSLSVIADRLVGNCAKRSVAASRAPAPALRLGERRFVGVAPLVHEVRMVDEERDQPVAAALPSRDSAGRRDRGARPPDCGRAPCGRRDRKRIHAKGRPNTSARDRGAAMDGRAQNPRSARAKLAVGDEAVGAGYPTRASRPQSGCRPAARLSTTCSKSRALRLRAHRPACHSRRSRRAASEPRRAVALRVQASIRHWQSTPSRPRPAPSSVHLLGFVQFYEIRKKWKLQRHSQPYRIRLDPLHPVEPELFDPPRPRTSSRLPSARSSAHRARGAGAARSISTPADRSSSEGTRFKARESLRTGRRGLYQDHRQLLDQEPGSEYPTLTISMRRYLG